MAKMLAYGKRKPKKYSARQDKEKRKEVKEPLIPPPPDHAVMHEGLVGDTPYEIVYSPFSGGISYSMSKPSVRIVAAVDRLPPDKSSHLIEYACKCREFYVEYHDNLNPGEKMSMPSAKKYACDKAMEWMSERYGSRTVQTVLKSFEKACVTYAEEVAKRNEAYDYGIHEQFYLHQTITDDEKADKLDGWELDV